MSDFTYRRQMIVKIHWFAVVASAVTLGLAVAQSPSPKEEPRIAVSRDGRALEIHRASSRAPVRVPVLDRCGDPAVGKARIRSTQLTDESVSVTYEKHCEAKVDLKRWLLSAPAATDSHDARAQQSLAADGAIAFFSSNFVASA